MSSIKKSKDRQIPTQLRSQRGEPLRLTGAEAYQFLLEVISGLHSSIVGETEVFGQFKEFAKNSDSPRFSSLLQNLIADCKEVRARHLSGLGAQSYGSLVRKLAKGSQHLEIWGAGQLAQEILPWLEKSRLQLKVRARSLEKVEPLLKRYAQLQFTPWEAPVAQDMDVLVIAAPLSKFEIETKLQGTSNPKLVIDLRDLQAERLEKNCITLQDLAQYLDSDKSKIQNAKTLSIAEIAQKALARKNQVYNRPYGWEDFCA